MVIDKFIISGTLEITKEVLDSSPVIRMRVVIEATKVLEIESRG